MATAGDVLSYHQGTLNGTNSNEVQLTPLNVQTASFGKLFTTVVDGQVYAEPLVKSGVMIASGPNTTSGSAGLHNVAFVATEHDTLYAIDSVNGAILWQRSFLDASVAVNNTLNASAITTVPNGDTGSGDITPEIGISSTPVIDPNTGVLYVSAKTKETIGGTAHYVQRLHAINLADGTDVISPYLIGDTTNGNTNKTQIYVYGAGEGSVTDPYNNTGKKVIQFNALHEAQRQALSLVGGKLYGAWASHGDNGPYHGEIVAWDVSNIATTGFVLSGVLNTSPNGGLAGIWGGGGQLAFESDGTTFYFETGNGPGSHGNPALNSDGFPADGDYYEALVKVVGDSTTSPTNQNVNGWGFKVADYFVPFNQVALDNADEDFGSASPLILPDSAGVNGHPHLLIASGKEGKLYVVDRDNMGRFTVNNDNVVNAVPNGVGNNTVPVQLGGALSTAAYFNGSIYYTSGYSGTSNAYKINADGSLTQTSQTPENSLGYLPGSVSVSADGTSNGIVWVMDRNANQIHAYNANSMANELWNSGKVNGDAVGSVVKFAVPTISHGQVYVGTSNSMVVYGLIPPAGQAPSTPTLKATALSGTSVNLTWTDSSVLPNTATGYLIEQSADGTNFTQVTTAAAGTTALAVGGLKVGTTYSFRIRGKNNAGISLYSAVVTVTTTNQVAILDFSNGFSGAASLLTLNGSAVLNGARLELTSSHNDQVASVFSSSAVDVTRFSTLFSFQLSRGLSTADGFTFTFQGQGATAIGPGGGGLGYGTDGANGGKPITRSVAIKFDLYSNAGEGVDSTGLYSNGASPTNAGSIDLTNSTVDLHSGDLFLVSMNYDGKNLAVTITDNASGKSATQNYAVDIPGNVGGPSAYVGFTAGTGGLTATQDILNWTYSPTVAAVQAPNPPTGMGAVPASATSISLNWTGNSTNQLGFILDRASDTGFTQGVVSQTLPAGPNTFTDSVTGLAPGSAFFYRIRAFNDAGASANSDVVQVTIPLPPPRPSDLKVTGISSTRVDLSWVDNASTKAHAYLILRKIGSGTFANYATLPATSDVPGSTYNWSDTGVTPGTAYEYHIEDVNTSGNNDFVGTNLVTIPAPPSGLSAAATGASLDLSWNPTAGAIRYNVYRGTTPGIEGITPIAVVSNGTTYTDMSVSPGGTYYYTVSAVNANINRIPLLPAESAASDEVMATTANLLQPVPSPWTSLDVGPPALTGSATYSGGVFTVKGAGSDIWSHNDEFQFVDQPLTGNGSIVARVTSLQQTDPWAKAGIMIRATTDTGSANVMLTAAGRGWLSFQSRANSNGGSDHLNTPSYNGPVWLKLARSGDTFTGSYSSDGMSYTLMGSFDVPMGTTVLAGLAVTSHAPGALTTATIDNVSLLADPTVQFSNAGFETPNVGSRYVYDPKGAGWTFRGNAGVEGNGSAWNAANSPEGRQAAFLQGGPNPGSISQSFSLSSGGSYNVSFAVASRQGQIQPIKVVLDGNQIGNLITPTGNDFNRVVVSLGNLSDGSHTLSFSATDRTGDKSSFIDGVSLEPAGSTIPINTSLPPGWADTDIGGPGSAGTASYDSGVYTVAGGGSDIWNTSDQFHLADVAVSGDFTMITRVTSQQTTDPWAKAGIMVRANSAANSAYAFIAQTPGNGTAFQARVTTGAAAVHTPSQTIAIPVWLRLQRIGTTMIGSISSDGTSWIKVGSYSIPLANNVLVGLAVTSHNNGTTSTATFDNVSISKQ